MSDHAPPPPASPSPPDPNAAPPPAPWPGYDPLTWSFPQHPAAPGAYMPQPTVVPIPVPAGYSPAGAAPQGYAPQTYAPEAYVPVGSQPAAPGYWIPPVSPPTRAAQQKRGGILGVLFAIGAALLKYGVIFLKLFKFGTVLSIVFSYFTMVLIFGWQFGAGVILLILVHEIGHMLFARAEGLPVSAPIFLGPLGAFITIKKPFVDARQEAVIAIGGPVVGTLGALVCFVIAGAQTFGHLQFLFLGLASFGFFINLLNLVPMVPLDGGRVAAALSKWFLVLGLMIMVGLLLVTGNEFLILFLLLGGYTTWHRFRAAKLGQDTPKADPKTRVWIGLAYLLMLGTTAGGMILAHHALVQNGYVIR